MEAPEEVTTNVVKGKRTKRQRVESPIPFGVTTDSSSGDNCGNAKNGANISPATSLEEFQDSTEEEEDMANCLILLARGHFSRNPEKLQTDHHYHHHHQNDASRGGVYGAKFNSRKFMETASSTGSGKIGYYVYECKTCSRTFPSFQALGGHRASHKKPKAMIHNDGRKHVAFSSDEEDDHYRNMSTLSLQLCNSNQHKNHSNKVTYSSNHNKAKIHECSICGAEFTSGQALGGHMRRHRGSIGTSGTTLSLTKMAIESEEPKKEKNLLSLELDLNLPAPEDDKTHFASKQHQHQQPQQQQQQQQQEQQNPPLVFSAPALVDCHY